MKKTTEVTKAITAEATTFTPATLTNIPEAITDKVNAFNKSKGKSDKDALLEKLRKENKTITESAHQVYINLIEDAKTDAEFNNSIKLALNDSYNVYTLATEKNGAIHIDLEKKVPSLWAIDTLYSKSQKHKNKKLIFKKSALDALNTLYRDLLNKAADALEVNKKFALKSDKKNAHPSKSISQLRKDCDALYKLIGLPSVVTRSADINMLIDNIKRAKFEGNKIKNKSVSVSAFAKLIQSAAYHRINNIPYDIESNNKAVVPVATDVKKTVEKLRDIA